MDGYMDQVDYLDDALIPYVAPLGRLVLVFGAAEAGLAALVERLRGQGPQDASDILNKGEASRRCERVQDLIRQTTKLTAEEKDGLTNTVSDFFNARQDRHRLIHDEFALGWDEDKGVVVVTVGRTIKDPTRVNYNEPKVEEIEHLATRVALFAKVFSFVAENVLDRIEEKNQNEEV